MRPRMQNLLWLAICLMAATLGLSCSKTATNEPNAEEGKTADNTAAKKGERAPSRPVEQSVAVPVGTELAVVLDQSLSSNASHAGDEFDATLSDPIQVDGKTVVPKGARLKGRVISAQASGRLQTPAELSVALTSIEVGGTSHEIQTGPITLRGKSHKTRDIEIIGGGSALGAIVGAIAGHGKGAAIGAAAGAGAGTAGAMMTGKKDIVLGAETHLSFKLSQPVNLRPKN